MDARRVVVTGGAGFLGSYLCERLLAEGNQVVCLDNFLTGKPANIAHLMGDPAFRCLRCDLTEFLHVPGAVDLVLHFASPASPVDYLRLPIQTLKVGAIGTWHALGLAKEKHARFVLASTSEYLGATESSRDSSDDRFHSLAALDRPSGSSDGRALSHPRGVRDTRSWGPEAAVRRDLGGALRSRHAGRGPVRGGS